MSLVNDGQNGAPGVQFQPGQEYFDSVFGHGVCEAIDDVQGPEHDLPDNQQFPVRMRFTIPETGEERIEWYNQLGEHMDHNYKTLFGTKCGAADHILRTKKVISYEKVINLYATGLVSFHSTKESADNLAASIKQRLIKQGTVKWSEQV